MAIEDQFQILEATATKNPKAGTQNLPEEIEGEDRFEQWRCGNGEYVPVGKTTNRLDPGFYNITTNRQNDPVFQKKNLSTSGVFRIQNDVFDDVIKNVERFWSKSDKYEAYGRTHKFGVLLYGPPGTGKSCLAKLIVKDVIDRGGVAINFETPHIYRKGIEALRSINPDIPIVTWMEDIDEIVDNYLKKDVLNILDGAYEIDNVVYVATTNYPEELGSQFLNRPSRFKKFAIKEPEERVRRQFFEKAFSVARKADSEESFDDYSIDKWVEDTENLVIDHLEELFNSVVVMGDDYDETLDRLKNMEQEIDGNYESDNGLGF